MASGRQPSWFMPVLVLPAEDPRPLSPDDTVLARYAIQLALDPAAWVRRRVETFEFLDAETVRRRMSVSFEVPEEEREPHDGGLERGHEVYVPVMLLLKQNFRNFDMIDEQGNSLVIPPSERNAELAALGVVDALERVRPRDSRGTEERLEEEIRRIVGVGAEDPVTEAREFVKPEGRFDGLTEPMESTERERLRSLITYLGRGFMLMVRLPYEPGTRRLVKFSYDVTHRAPKIRQRSRRVWRWANRIMSSCGLMARFEVLDGLGVGLAQSYHAEAVPPAETVVAEAILEVTDMSAEEGISGRRVVDQDDHRIRPHVNTRRAASGDRGKLYLLIYTQRESLLVPLWLAATLITSVLMFVPAYADNLDGQTLSALLLVPFALAAFYIRNPENRYVTSMLRGVRALAGIPVAAGALVIAMLGLGYLKPVSDDGQVPAGALDLACGAVVASAVATALLTLALLTPLVGRRYRQALTLAARRPPEADTRAAGLSIFRVLSAKFSPPATVENMGVAPDPLGEDLVAEGITLDGRQNRVDA